MNRPTPLDAARDFRINEMFFSTTDRKGVIQSGNDIFVRVSGYSQEQLVGTAHNIIRHPDMPRAVFRLVWDYLGRGQPVAGLVKNLASDGRYYWVVALLMPVEGGHLSIRFKPSGALQPVVAGLYAEMLRVEREQVAAKQDPAVGMAAATDLMLGALRSKGFEDYDAFMRVLLHDELKGRDAALQAQGLSLFPETLVPDGSALGASLAKIHGTGLACYREIDTVYAQLDEFAALNRALAEKSASVLGMTKDFRFIAFNTALRSSRIGEDGRSLGVIADYLNGCADRTSAAVAALLRDIEAISRHLNGVIFDLAAARLQLEMVLAFAVELATNTAASRSGDTRRMIGDLRGAFTGTVRRAVGALQNLTNDLKELGTVSDEMRRLVLTLQVAQVGGLVESSRLQGDDSFAAMFEDLRQGVGRTKDALTEVDQACERLGSLAKHAPVIAASVGAAEVAMSEAIGSLAAAPEATPRSTVEPVVHSIRVPRSASELELVAAS